MNTPSVAAKYALSWLLDFVQTNLSELTDEQKRRVRADLRVFANDSLHVAEFERLGALDYKKRYRPGADLPEFDSVEASMTPWPTVKQRHAELKTAISALKNGEDWTYSSHLQIERRMATWNGRHYIAKSWTGPERDMLFNTVGDALDSAGDTLQPCANRSCGNWFVRQGKAVYCSMECRNKANWANFQKKHPKRKRDYRAEYLARVMRERP